MSSMDKNISPAVIKRLPRYYRYLGALKAKNITRISSKELSERMKVTASQIRQDLNNFGGFGQQGYGYNVENLYVEIGKILGLDKSNQMIIVGAGNLGQALANYQDFNNNSIGFQVIALFDVNPKLIGITVHGVEVHDIDDMEEFIKNHEIKIAALTLPQDQAPKIAKELASWGIKGFWNFAPVDLTLPDSVTVENVHLAESLMTLTYNIHSREDSETAE
ncbi:redox-sensing transcriptional repressor Rex [Anaerostipes sp.]|uniref:redox-sensing transcriptional repressor Rex n=1 Tax=Anaerostipes sp. TaxID=1872530 RepID=UPI0025BA45F2|nr:redox-sensing transcriptional repressor Rex [Anaerostipes sp.]MBS7009320.1 redox-sensing transcriptional repressor Rex [Anaerostipes sp.]